MTERANHRLLTRAETAEAALTTATEQIAECKAQLTQTAKDWIAAEQRLTEVEAERDAYKRDFDAELDGNAQMRTRLGARESETMFAFVDRLTREARTEKCDKHEQNLELWVKCAEAAEAALTAATEQIAKGEKHEREAWLQVEELRQRLTEVEAERDEAVKSRDDADALIARHGFGKAAAAVVRLRAALRAFVDAFTGDDYDEGVWPLMTQARAALAATETFGDADTQIARLVAEQERLREALEAVLRSAVPIKQNHPTMWQAWQDARSVLERIAHVEAISG